MKESILDSILINSRPHNYKLNADFTNKVMQRVNASGLLTQFEGKKKRHNLLFSRRPRFAAILLIAIAALLVLSGTTYALYKTLWQQPVVHVTQETKSASGRTQVVLSLSQCGGGSDVASHYELKSNATITASEIPQVVQAHCELDAIQNWALTTFPNSGSGATAGIGKTTAYDDTQIQTSMATQIKTIGNGSVTFMGQAKYNQSDMTFTVGPHVRYIAEGQDVKADTIKPSDPVAYVMSNVEHMTPQGNCTAESCSMEGSQGSSTLVAIVKLDLPFADYDQFAWQSLTELDTCVGNPADTCTIGFAGGIDIYENSAPQSASNIQFKQIQGTITEINGSTVTINTTSGRTFTLTTPTDVVSAYNTQKAAQYYDGQSVHLGSNISISYVEPTGQASQTLTAANITEMMLQIEQVGKSTPSTEY